MERMLRSWPVDKCVKCIMRDFKGWEGIGVNHGNEAVPKTQQTGQIPGCRQGPSGSTPRFTPNLWSTMPVLAWSAFRIPPAPCQSAPP
jgi:hypothetical protein